MMIDSKKIAICALFSLGSVSALTSQVTVSHTGITNNTTVTAPTYTISALDTTTPLVSVSPAFGTGSAAVSGQVAGIDALSSSDSFSFTITATTAWDEATATSNLATFNTHVAAIGTTDAYYHNNRVSVDGFDMTVGEALFFTFNTDSLSGDLSLTEIGINLGGGDDLADFWVWDSDTQTLLSDQQAKSTSISFSDGFALTTGDIVVLANAGFGETNTGNFRMDNIVFNVAAIPEPSMFGLIAGIFAVGFFGTSRRRARQ